MQNLQISDKKDLEKVYPACRDILGPHTWERIIAACLPAVDPEAFPDSLSSQRGEFGFPEFIPELARLERAFCKAKEEIEIPLEVDQLVLNPTVQLLQLSWRNLALLLNPGRKGDRSKPEPGEEMVMVWRDPKTGNTEARPAREEDLLVLKMVVEKIESEEAASEGGLPVGAVDAALDRAVRRGILLRPGSRIRRTDSFPKGQDIDDRFFSTSVFTLQWHITQACDLHCKHCYDRSNISPLKLEQAIGILDDLRSFRRSRYVRGHISFSGGNPLLYPQFTDLYRAASERGFSLAILGNVAPRERIEELIEIQHPSYYQVSLEGLPEHNDAIRGEGYFERVIQFLGVLRDLEVYSMVMLTLTKDNMDQILPLAEMLRNHTDYFTFNRLSMVGEGANLRLPSRDEFKVFLEEYVRAAQDNPIMGLKDNLINILLRQKERKPFGGCAGYGCGAAFNFITLLPDGEVHACRKFPSPIGNVLKEGIAGVYESEMARKYRAGCNACRSCAIRPVCGGCLAIAYSNGLDIFEERDPYCFVDHR